MSGQIVETQHVHKSMKESTFLADALVVMAASLLMGFIAQAKFYLPFTPVPITVQAPAALLLGAVLGPRRAGFSMALYLVEGILGLPFFSGGHSGLTFFMGPTGGYLVGMCFGSYITGWIHQQGVKPTFLRLLFSLSLGMGVVYTLGVAWLSLFVGRQCLDLGLYPFLSLDAVKVVCAAVSYEGWRAVFDFLKNIGRSSQ